MDDATLGCSQVGKRSSWQHSDVNWEHDSYILVEVVFDTVKHEETKTEQAES